MLFIFDKDLTSVTLQHQIGLDMTMIVVLLATNADIDKEGAAQTISVEEN